MPTPMKPEADERERMMPEHGSTDEMLRVLGLVIHDLNGRVEAGKLAVVVRAADHIREQRDEIERLRGALEAVTTYYQVTHCHSAARAGLAGLPVGQPPEGEAI